MTSSLLSQLGQVLVQSLWQGAIFGSVLMILLVFVRQAKWRYALACLTLFTMLAWFVVSAVSVLLPARDFTTATNAVAENRNTPPSELLATPAPSQISEAPTNTSALNQTDVTRAVPTATHQETRASFPRVSLQDFLPYVSLLWMIGVAVLSLRLLISVYLLKRYRKESFELSEPWIHERLHVLAQRMKLKQRVKLLQTTTLTTPAVMGVVKPLLLIPSSLVSGLSIQQLDLLLAHELAHIKRCDYLVNILQTLAETLLFYHPVVWWVSKVIRQERENCCDDMTLQVTGQSALEYAEVLLCLEKSRQGLVLAASNGSLLRRVERLLNPTRVGADVRSSLVALTLVVCLSLTFVVNAVDAQPIQVSKVPYVFNADISIDPTNPERIAITVNSAEEFICDLENCDARSLLYTSSDAGKNFQEQLLFNDEGADTYAYPSFDATGNFYTSMTFYLEDDSFATRTYLFQTDPTMKVLENFAPLEDDRISDSKLFADPKTNTLYLNYLELQEVESDMWSGTPKLRTSTDGGKTWSNPISVLKTPTWEMNGGRAMLSSLFLGENNELAVVWFQEDYVFVEKDGQYTYTEPVESAPYSIWVASSEDSGKTFSKPKKLNYGAGFATGGESWGGITTAYTNGIYYVLTRQVAPPAGRMGLVLLSSSNNGRWSFTRVNGDLELYTSFPYEVTPGLSVTADGMIDIVFYAQTNAPDCISVPTQYAVALPIEWADKCSYNVYYTYSKNEGKIPPVFTEPRQLNDEPIVGSQFVRIFNVTSPGEAIGIASTNDAAYPVWIGNRADVEGTQAYMMKIAR